MPIATVSYTITWEKLPDDFPLPDEPVDNIDQPLLAAALRAYPKNNAGAIANNMLATQNRKKARKLA